MTIKRIESIEDQMNGVVTYDLGDGRYQKFELRAVREYGIRRLLEAYNIDVSTERVSVIQNGKRIGTVPATFDPYLARSHTFLYDIRQGDFTRDDLGWIVSNSLGNGDIEAIAGFAWDANR